MNEAQSAEQLAEQIEAHQDVDIEHDRDGLNVGGLPLDESIGDLQDVVKPAPAPSWKPETEAEARDFGWKSPDEWKGEVPAGYIDNPDDYMARLEKHTPFRKLREKTDKLEAEHRRIEAAMEAGRVRERERMVSEYEGRIASITAQQRAAAETGDLEAFDRLEAAKRRVQPPQQEAAPRTDQLAPLREAKPWLNDPVLVQNGKIAIDAALQSGALPPGSDAATQVEYAETHLKRYFPHMFQEPAPEPAAPTVPKVDGGGLGGGRGKAGFDTLPAEAKAAFKRDIGRGIFEDTKADKEFFFNEYTNG